MIQSSIIQRNTSTKTINSNYNDARNSANIKVTNKDVEAYISPASSASIRRPARNTEKDKVGMKKDNIENKK